MSYRISPVTHGNFLSTETQTYTGSTTDATSNGQPIYFNSSNDLFGVTLSGTTGIVVSSRGDYMFNVSAIVTQSVTNGVAFEIWFLINGAIVSTSNTRIVNWNTVAETILAVQLVLHLSKGDVVQLRWYSSSANGVLQATAATGSVRPASPSIIVTATKVSE